MAIELIVTSDEGVIELKEQEDASGITELEFLYDSADDSTEKKYDAIKGLILKGTITSINKDQTLNLAKWALYEKGTAVYRGVNVKLIDDLENIIREYSFSAMFVVDYKESFSATGNGTFEIKLYQKAKNTGIEVFA